MPARPPLRRTISGLAAAALLVAIPQASMAQAYPAKAIRFVVPYSAGGTTDLVARTVGAHMSQTLGRPVIIDNRAGAGGNIGLDVVAKAPPDGYTIGMGAMSTNALNPHIYHSVPFDPRKDFTSIGLLGNSTIVLEVNAASPIKTVSDLLEEARKRPGQLYATPGAGTSMHLAGVLFADLSKTKWEHVPYKGSAPLLNDLLGRQINVAFDNLPASLPHIQAGKLRALAVAGSQRSPLMPNVPTLSEAGLPGYSVEPWFGVYGPAGLSPEITTRLNAALVAALNDPTVKSKLTEAGFTPRSSSPIELDTLTKREYERLGKLARSAKMTAE